MIYLYFQRNISKIKLYIKIDWQFFLTNLLTINENNIRKKDDKVNKNEIRMIDKTN